MKIYAINKDGEEISKEADKGYYGEDVYNDRVWSPEKPPKQSGKIAVLKNKTWILEDDIQGTYYSKEDGKEIIVPSFTSEKLKCEKGIDISNFVKEKPSNELKFPFYDKGWKEDTQKLHKLNEQIAKDERGALIFDRMKKIAEAELISEGKIMP